MHRYIFGFICLLLSLALLACGVPEFWGGNQAGPAISVDWHVPSEINPPFTDGTPPSGGALNATPDQAAAFAWQEFIALNWPAGPQEGKPGQRDTHSDTYKFGDPNYSGPLVWQTFRGKVEIFPGPASLPIPPFSPGNYFPPPGYPGTNRDASLGYDALPKYAYKATVSACDASQTNDSTPWINLDETDQIGLDDMYAGVVEPDSSPGNSSPQLIRFLAKANRAEYVYVAQNSSVSSPSDPSHQWWAAIPAEIVAATKAYLRANQASPPQNSKYMVSLPNGTIEIKAAWRPLNPSERRSGRFHMQRVRFYEGSTASPCYRDQIWGLVALHIIQKTPSAPYFIYATFEQADNILTANGKPVEDNNGNILPPELAAATTPQVCLVDPQPALGPPQDPEMASVKGSVVETANPAICKMAATQTWCGTSGSQLYYRNKTDQAPQGGNICVNRRDNAIPDYVVRANEQAHAVISDYLKRNGFASVPWLSYKLINVQYVPYDKIPDPNIPNGSPYTAQPPYTAKNPAPSSFYQANIVVETNRSLQLFSGGLSPSIATDWNADGTPHKNTFYAGHFYNMGGCLGCHGSQGQNPKGQAGDFSVILARGAVVAPMLPGTTSSTVMAIGRGNSR